MNQFGDCFLASSFGLVGRTTAHMQPRAVVYSGSNLHVNSLQTEVHKVPCHPVHLL